MKRLIEKRCYNLYSSKYVDLEDLVEKAQSHLGILNNELWGLLYEEYNKHSSVYEMRHNCPHLLMSQVPRLVKQCKCLTSNGNNSYIETLDNLIPIANFISKRYPEAPTEGLELLKTLYGKLSPLFASEYNPRGREAIYNKWVNRNILLFYSDWANLISNEDAAKRFYMERLAFPLEMMIQEKDKPTAKMIICRELRIPEIEELPFNILSWFKQKFL